jgi:hypothetical protein
MEPFEAAKYYYGFLCTPEEIERIFSVKTAEDFLLKLRVDAVIDHTRMYRVMMARKRKGGSDWCFGNHFSKREFVNVLDELYPADRAICETVSAGFLFNADPNGSCMQTPFGNIIIISESLKYFLYFMNLAFLEFPQEIPQIVRIQALRIAIRTMLQTEALDFELDPRGVIPDDVERILNAATDEQISFVISHEYAHHALGHIKNSTSNQRPLLSRFAHETAKEASYTFHNYQQQQELDADIWALSQNQLSDAAKSTRGIAAALFFAFLDVYSQVKEQLFPSANSYQTHPDPLSRLNHAFSKLGDIEGFDLNNLLLQCEEYKIGLQKNVATYSDDYETYGSIYLGPWRGPVLIDRVHY